MFLQYAKAPKSCQKSDFRLSGNRQPLYAPVAQLDRAIASDAMCRAFESHQAYHKTSPSARFLRAGLFYGSSRRSDSNAQRSVLASGVPAGKPGSQKARLQVGLFSLCVSPSRVMLRLLQQVRPPAFCGRACFMVIHAVAIRTHSVL